MWQDYILRHFGSLINSQTWKEEESVSKQELRAALLETACMLNEKNCTEQAKAMFVKYKESNGTFRWVCWMHIWQVRGQQKIKALLLYIFALLCVHRIPGDLQQVVFNVAAQSSEHWMSLLDMYTQVTYDAEKRKMLLGLASTQDVRHIAWYLLQFA